MLFIIGCEFFVNYKINFNSHITAKIEKVKEKIGAKIPKTTAFFLSVKAGMDSLDEKANNVKEATEGQLRRFFALITGKLKREKSESKSAPAQESENKKEAE